MELYFEYSDTEEYKNLFSDDKLDVSTFDKWWLINRLDLSREVDEVDPVNTKLMPLIGNENIDNWIKTKVN